MGDKLNQINNSGDNNLGHFFKATDFDEIAMKVKIIKIILYIHHTLSLLFFMWDRRDAMVCLRNSVLDPQQRAIVVICSAKAVSAHL